MKFEIFRDRVNEIYAAKFPKSLCNCMIYACLGKSITIDLHLAENMHECLNNIMANDMYKITLGICLPDNWSDTDELPAKMEMTAWNNSIRVKPVNKYMYCSSEKVAFRKVTGDAEKIIKAFERFTDRLYDKVMAEYQADNLMPDDAELIHKKNYK